MADDTVPGLGLGRARRRQRDRPKKAAPPVMAFRRKMTDEELELEIKDLGQIAVLSLGTLLRQGEYEVEGQADAEPLTPELRLKAITLALEYSVAKPARKMGVTDRGDVFGKWLAGMTDDEHDADPGDA